MPVNWSKKKVVPKTSWLGGRNHIFSKHSMNSLRSDSISYFVAQIAERNQRLNIASKKYNSSKDLLVRNVLGITFFFSIFFSFSHLLAKIHRAASRNIFLRIISRNILGHAKRQSRNRTSSFMSLRINLKNIPHEEVFRGCTIIGIFFDSCVAKRYKQIDMRSCLSEASSSNDYDNITSGLRDRTFL